MSNSTELQNEAEEAIENDIKNAEALKNGKNRFFLDVLREKWDEITFQSTVGNRIIRVILALCTGIAIHTAFQYGFADEESMFCDFMKLTLTFTDNTPLLLMVFEAMLTLVWLFVPVLGTLLTAVTFYMCFAGLSPITLFLAFFVLLLFIFEDRPVSMLMIALAPIVLLTHLKVGYAFAVFAAFASTRKNCGVVRTMSFVYFALLELSAGGFGNVFNTAGEQVIPVTDGTLSASELVLSYIKLLQVDTPSDLLLGKTVMFICVYFAVGFIFTKLLNLRYSGKQKEFFKNMQIEIKDGMIFAALLGLLCLLPTVLRELTVFRESRYGYSEIILSVAAVYILTRIIAGQSPYHGNITLREDRRYIFISYSHYDRDRIAPYLQILRKKGYEFWYDSSIATGTEWQGVIANNLKNCTCFLAFISENSIVSDYCLKEINYATSRQKPMAVILLDDVMLPPVLEMHLASLQAVQRKDFGSNTDCVDKVCEMEKLNDCRY